VGLFTLSGVNFDRRSFAGSGSFYFRADLDPHLIFEREVQECIQEKITSSSYWVYLDRYDRIGLTKKEGRENADKNFSRLDL
jgi:hypothetical protein